MVTSTAPTAIIFNTGFHVKAGASFSAKIVNNSGGRKSKSSVPLTTPVNYATPSTYSNNTHSYALLAQNNIVSTNIVNSVSTSIFSIYPAASNGIFRIDNKELVDYVIEVINSVGQIVIWPSQNLEKFNITNKANGFYFVRITSDNRSYIFKILKK